MQYSKEGYRTVTFGPFLDACFFISCILKYLTDSKRKKTHLSVQRSKVINLEKYHKIHETDSKFTSKLWEQKNKCDFNSVFWACKCCLGWLVILIIGDHWLPVLTSLPERQTFKQLKHSKPELAEKKFMFLTFSFQHQLWFIYQKTNLLKGEELAFIFDYFGNQLYRKLFYHLPFPTPDREICWAWDF